MAKVLMFVFLLLSASAIAGERYSVVVVTGFDRSTEHKVLSDTELKALKDALGSESMLFSRAVSAATKEWAASPGKEKKQFPVLQKRTMRVLQTFSSQEEADKKLQSYFPRKDDDPKKKQPAKKPPDEKKVLAEKQQQALIKDAVAMVTAQLTALAQGKTVEGGEGGEVKPGAPVKPARNDAEDLE